jgi:hypothetical protein
VAIPEAVQSILSFLAMVKKTTAFPETSRNKRIAPPLAMAKNKILEALRVQTAYVALVAKDKPLPN